MSAHPRGKIYSPATFDFESASLFNELRNMRVAAEQTRARRTFLAFTVFTSGGPLSGLFGKKKAKDDECICGVVTPHERCENMSQSEAKEFGAVTGSAQPVAASSEDVGETTTSELRSSPKHRSSLPHETDHSASHETGAQLSDPREQSPRLASRDIERRQDRSRRRPLSSFLGKRTRDEQVYEELEERARKMAALRKGNEPLFVQEEYIRIAPLPLASLEHLALPTDTQSQETAIMVSAPPCDRIRAPWNPYPVPVVPLIAFARNSRSSTSKSPPFQAPMWNADPSTSFSPSFETPRPGLSVNAYSTAHHTDQSALASFAPINYELAFRYMEMQLLATVRNSSLPMSWDDLQPFGPMMAHNNLPLTNAPASIHPTALHPALGSVAAHPANYRQISLGQAQHISALMAPASSRSLPLQGSSYAPQFQVPLRPRYQYRRFSWDRQRKPRRGLKIMSSVAEAEDEGQIEMNEAPDAGSEHADRATEVSTTINGGAAQSGSSVDVDAADEAPSRPVSPMSDDALSISRSEVSSLHAGDDAE